jgi:adenine-specific DNA-methyltransferase
MFDMQEKLKKLKEICDLFNSNIKEYKSIKYDEANTRTQFIDRFFELLDWDIANLQGFSENYKEVVREDKVIIEGKPKAPDYSFRIGGNRKFFLEAKKPSVNIKEEVEPAFQIRRYGYTAKLPLSILTDFEEFAVYDTRIKPEKNDKASVARVFYCTYEEYEKQFEFIYNTFSKNAILKGSFDKYVVENKNKKGTTEVDKEFLKLIEEWRESLAKDIARKNKELDIYSLNNSVQVIIDRIIFLRIAEDRSMEKYGLLQEIIGKDKIYSQLNKIFLKANDKYNSGLFKPEKWISDLDIDDKVFQNIIKYLYYPECPYELSVLPIEILGNIYEQFLGKTIRLTSAHQAKVEEKEEVRKAGGVYYTPQYIVNYIVENTVGEKINGLDLFNHPRLTILDPACGSGSFLVGAYSYLLSKYLESYTDKKRLEKCLKNGLIYQVSQNTFRLGIEVKQQILINHIFGVDIDNQAVEVTKLSLLLKLMEDENTESADRLFKHSALKLLPDLSNNIKCGNSLIGNDFYNDKDLNLFDKEDMRKVNTFDWEKEFSAIFKDGGFDCVIGNPPYVRSQQIEQLVKDYLVKAYNDSASYQPDTFSFFIHKGIINLNDSGLFGYIVPNGILTNSYYSKLRYFILKNTAIKVIVDLKSNVFDSASVDTSIFILKREKKLVKIENNKLFIGEYSSRLESKVITPKNVISQKALLETDKYVFNSNTNIESLSIVTKIKKSTIHLEKFVSVKAGMKVRKDFVVNEKPNDKRYRKFLLGSSINPYNLQWKNKWVCYDKSLESNFTNQAFRDEEIFLNEDKILIRQVMGENRIYATIDKEKYFIDQSIYILLPTNSSYSTEYLLALICSKLMTYFFKQTLSDRKETFPKIKGDQIKLLPIKEIISHNEKKNYNELVNKIVAVISTQKSINGSTTDSDKKLLRQKFDLLDKQIDTLVYELYGLTEEEIKIVEGVSDGIIN